MSDHVVVRPAGRTDVPAMAAVWLGSALQAYASIFPGEAPKPTLDQLVATLGRDLQRGAGFVAVVADDVVGCVVATDDGELGRLYVHPQHWGAGLGARLHDAALHRLRADGHRQARLWVLEANPARAMYERRGWRLDGRRREVYPGVDDVGYARALGDGVAVGR